MIKFGKAVVKCRIPILIISILLLIPSIFGILHTRVNYDVLYYLPKDIETMKGQDILSEDFGKGAFAMFMAKGMEQKDVTALKCKLEKVEHVASVIWYDNFIDSSVPMEILPQKYQNALNSGDTTLMAIFFDTTTSADETIDAVKEIRSISGKQCFLSGMSAVVTDTKTLAEKEEPIYVLIAVVLCSIILALFMDSFLIPVIFLSSIGMAIVYNLGTNVYFGEISYITKALAAVLQLGTTMDYSIFLWHSYKEQKERFEGDKERAMAHAISGTATAVFGSSLTTVAGFVALCFMRFTLGRDIGIVMAKGIVFGLISCITILPSMILVLDKALEKTSHRALIPKAERLSKFIIRHYPVFLITFLIILIPALYGYNHSQVYYKLDDSLPKDLESVVANTKLANDFDMNSTHMLLIDSKLPIKDVQNMTDEMEKVGGVKYALGLESLIGSNVPLEVIPDSIVKILKSDRYQLMIVGSKYMVASDEVNNQITELNNILKKYDPKGMLIGEAPCTKDLITITDKDFNVVSIISIAAIFFIIFFVLKSGSLPVILVAVIELAIFINMGIPYFTGTKLPFVASIVIGTIQLGATVDYAILMTSRYKKERYSGKNKTESVQIALSTSIPSIMVSALGFFAATFGVGAYSDIDLISALCNLMARGAIISMVVVIFLLPSMFMLLDKIICRTSLGFRNKAITNL